MDPAKPSLVTGLSTRYLRNLQSGVFHGIFVPDRRTTSCRAPSILKGRRRFLRDRAARLGVPSLLFMLVIHPFTVYWLLRNFDDPAIPSLAAAYRDSCRVADS